MFIKKLMNIFDIYDEGFIFRELTSVYTLLRKYFSRWLLLSLDLLPELCTLATPAADVSTQYHITPSIVFTTQFSITSTVL